MTFIYFTMRTACGAHCQCFVCQEVASVVFTVQCYDSMVCAVTVCVFVCVSVTSRCTTNMSNHRIMQGQPSDSSFLTVIILALLKYGITLLNLGGEGYIC